MQTEQEDINEARRQGANIVADLARDAHDFRTPRNIKIFKDAEKWFSETYVGFWREWADEKQGRGR